MSRKMILRITILLMYFIFSNVVTSYTQPDLQKDNSPVFNVDFKVKKIENETAMNSLTNRYDKIVDKWKRFKFNELRHPFKKFINEIGLLSYEDRIEIYQKLLNERIILTNKYNVHANAQNVFFRSLVSSGDIECLKFFLNYEKYRNSIYHAMYTWFVRNDSSSETNSVAQIVFGLLQEQSLKYNDNVYLKYFHPQSSKVLEETIRDKKLHPSYRELAVIVLAMKLKKDAINILRSYISDQTKLYSHGTRGVQRGETLGEFIKRWIKFLR